LMMAQNRSFLLIQANTAQVQRLPSRIPL